MDLPKQSFPEAQRPEAPKPPVVDGAEIRRAHAVSARRRTSVFARRARAAALADAEGRAVAEIALLSREYVEKQESWQADLDQAWVALLNNESEVVLAALAASLEDNQAAAAAVGVDGDEVSLVVLVPSVADVPERKPTTTPAGNLSLKKLTKTETSNYYALLVYGFMLVTLKECFAAAPGIHSAKIVAMRMSRGDVHGEYEPEAIAAAAVHRGRLQSVRWDVTDASTILHDCSSELHIRQKGAARELQRLDLTQHPDLRALSEAIQFDGAAGPDPKETLA